MFERVEYSKYAAGLLKMAGLYLVLGLLLGTGMAITHQFDLRPVHTHINLLGWASMGLTGLIYHVAPHLAANRLARWHFWLHSLGLPLMMVGLGAYSLGYTQMEPVIGLGAIALMAGLTIFAGNVFRNLNRLAGRQPQ